MSRPFLSSSSRIGNSAYIQAIRNFHWRRCIQRSCTPISGSAAHERVCVQAQLQPGSAKTTRNIIWFNLPFNKNVLTNIGRAFIIFVDKCFPTGHKLRKVFNKNTVKLSYSCTPSEWLCWKVKTGLDVASRQRCFVSCLTHQEFNTKCIYNNRHFKYPWNLHKGSLGAAQLLRCSDFFLCLQPETSSFLLFSVQRCGSRIIINFSSKHKLQRLLALLYGLARSIICHVITWLMWLSFNDQTYLLSSVEFLDAIFLNDGVWFL